MTRHNEDLMRIDKSLRPPVIATGHDHASRNRKKLLNMELTLAQIRLRQQAQRDKDQMYLREMEIRFPNPNVRMEQILLEENTLYNKR